MRRSEAAIRPTLRAASAQLVECQVPSCFAQSMGALPSLSARLRNSDTRLVVLSKSPRSMPTLVLSIHAELSVLINV